MGFSIQISVEKNNSFKSLIFDGIEYKPNQDISEKLNYFFVSKGRDTSVNR